MSNQRCRHQRGFTCRQTNGISVKHKPVTGFAKRVLGSAKRESRALSKTIRSCVRKVTAATRSDMYSSMVTAIGTLRGPLHGGPLEE